MGQRVVANVSARQAEAGVRHRLGSPDVGVRIGGGQGAELHILRAKHTHQGSPAQRRIARSVVDSIRHRRPGDRQCLRCDRACHSRGLGQGVVAGQGGVVLQDIPGHCHGLAGAHVLVGEAGSDTGIIQQNRCIGQYTHQCRRWGQSRPRRGVIFPGRHRHTGDRHRPGGNIRPQGRHGPGQDVVGRLGSRQGQARSSDRLVGSSMLVRKGDCRTRDGEGDIVSCQNTSEAVVGNRRIGRAVEHLVVRLQRGDRHRLAVHIPSQSGQIQLVVPRIRTRQGKPAQRDRLTCARGGRGVRPRHRAA